MRQDFSGRNDGLKPKKKNESRAKKKRERIILEGEAARHVINTIESGNKPKGSYQKILDILILINIPVTILILGGTLWVLTLQWYQGRDFTAYTKSQDSIQIVRDSKQDSINNTLTKTSHSLIKQYADAARTTAAVAVKSLDASDIPDLSMKVYPPEIIESHIKVTAQIHNGGNGDALNFTYRAHVRASKDNYWPDSIVGVQLPKQTVPAKQFITVQTPEIDTSHWSAAVRKKFVFKIVLTGEYERRIDGKKFPMNACSYYSSKDRGWLDCIVK